MIRVWLKDKCHAARVGPHKPIQRFDQWSKSPDAEGRCSWRGEPTREVYTRKSIEDRQDVSPHKLPGRAANLVSSPG